MVQLSNEEMMLTPEKLYVYMERPRQASLGFLVFNAKQPLPVRWGGVAWVGEELVGVHYATSIPSDTPIHEKYALLGAVKLVFVTDKDIDLWAREECKRTGASYDDFEWIDLLDMYLLTHNKKTGG